MISSSLFRPGDRFTIATSHSMGAYRCLDTINNTLYANGDMRNLRGTQCIVNAVRISDSGITCYALIDMPYWWNDEMSQEGQRMLQFLLPVLRTSPLF